jgi:hypothetical protein
MEELEQALVKYNMGDTKTIKEIIAEVDTDHVRFLFQASFSADFVFFEVKGRKDIVSFTKTWCTNVSCLRKFGFQNFYIKL